MKETHSPTIHGPSVKSPGLHNDFSEQEESMTASAMPPKFALTADANPGNPVKPPYGDQLHELGLTDDEIEAMSPIFAKRLIAVAENYAPSQWQQLRAAFTKAGRLDQFAATIVAFDERFEWLTAEDAISIEVFADMPFNTIAGRKSGHVELVNQAGTIGLRAIVPFEGFGGNLILSPDQTSTVLGRSVEGTTKEDFAEGMNQPRGTNYFRYQKNFMVGKNQGGGNVLDVQDRTWTWPLNNAWLQASVDRNDKIRFISDPSKPSTLFKRGGTIKDGLTVTGMELGVLLHKGFGPDVNTGEVKKGYLPEDEGIFADWIKIKGTVKSEGYLDMVDNEAYQTFFHDSQGPALAPKQYFSPQGDLVATQTNFFGSEHETSGGMGSHQIS
jgi:hypothetical protein